MRVLAGARWLWKERGRCISAGDFHAGARGRGESFGGGGGRYLARNRVSLPRWGLQTRRPPAAAALLSSPASVRDDPCSAATVLCCDTTSHRHGNRASPFHSGERDPRRGWEGGSCTLPCDGGTDGCQKARGELWRRISGRRRGAPRGPPRRGAQHSTHRIPPRSPRRQQRRRGTMGTADPSASLLSHVLLWDKSLRTQTQRELGTYCSPRRLEPRLLPS